MYTPKDFHCTGWPPTPLAPSWHQVEKAKQDDDDLSEFVRRNDGKNLLFLGTALRSFFRSAVEIMLAKQCHKQPIFCWFVPPIYGRFENCLLLLY